MAIPAVEERNTRAVLVHFNVAPLRSEQITQLFRAQVFGFVQRSRAEQRGRMWRFITARIVRWRFGFRERQCPKSNNKVGGRSCSGMVSDINAEESGRRTG